MFRRLLGAAPWLVALGCSAAGGPAPAKPSAPQAKAATSAAAAPASASGIEERAELGHYFDDEQVLGTIALFDSKDGKLACSDLEKCGRAYVPASTFKIANAMIALETEVVSDPETKLAWDGKEYSVKDWNRDHTLRSAIQVSCVPCFQGIARQVGQARMDEWLKRLDYGNADTSGGVDRFWLWGGLRITPLQQIDFLRRLVDKKLPISERTYEFVIDMLTLDVGSGHVLRGKTGSARRPEEAMDAAWFVGWVEQGQRRVFFATLIDGFKSGVDVGPVRRRLTERILRDMKALP